MKNQVVAVLGLITCIAIGFTQPAFSQGSWGVEAGVNLANIKGDGIDDDTDARSGLLLAAYYKYPLSNAPIILQPELIYSQKGLKFGSNGVLKIDYLVAAALAAYYFEVSDQVTPFLKAGPYIGFNVSAKQEINGNEGDVDDLNDIDAGVIIRAGIQIDRFEVGARFARGLTDAFSDVTGQNSVFGLFVGVGL